MKIAILGSRGIPANYGGFETFAEYLAVGLAKSGEEVEVYGPHYHDYKEKSYQGVRIVRIWNLDKFFNKVRFLRASTNLLYDIMSLIHVSFSRNTVIYMLGYAAGPALIIPRLFGKKMFVNPDGLEWKSGRWGPFARFWLYFGESACAKISHHLITDAEAIQKHFKERYDLETACIPYGTTLPDLAVSNAVNLPVESGQYYLAVARMVPETRVPSMIRGFLASGTNKKLLVIGPIADEKFFQSEVLPLVDGTKVQYLGAIYDRDLLTAYRAQTFCLLHGHASDGTNPSLLESMSCSSPVIAVDTVSNAAVLGENDGLYFTSDSDATACIERLEQYDQDRRIALGMTNREKVTVHYSWDLCVKRHVEVFRQFTPN